MMAGMKNQLEKEVTSEDAVVLVVFGDARLVRFGDRVLLDGGSMADRTEAIEWASANLRDQAVLPLSAGRRK